MKIIHTSDGAIVGTATDDYAGLSITVPDNFDIQSLSSFHVVDGQLVAIPQDPKLVGTLIEGVMCSATRDDQNGLTAVAMGITMARASGKTFPDTVFQFSNGNTMVITDANFDAAYALWVPFRQSFFSAS